MVVPPKGWHGMVSFNCNLSPIMLFNLFHTDPMFCRENVNVVCLFECTTFYNNLLTFEWNLNEDHPYGFGQQLSLMCSGRLALREAANLHVVSDFRMEWSIYA